MSRPSSANLQVPTDLGHEAQVAIEHESDIIEHITHAFIDSPLVHQLSEAIIDSPLVHQISEAILRVSTPTQSDPKDASPERSSSQLGHEAQVAIEHESDVIEQITHAILDGTHQISEAALHPERLKTPNADGSEHQETVLEHITLAVVENTHIVAEELGKKVEATAKNLDGEVFVV